MQARDGGEAIPPVVARIFSGDSTSPLTREASVMVRGEGLLSFCNGCGDGEVRCNGRGKPTPLRKVGGIVRMLNKQSVYKASVVVRGEGLLSFCNGCGDREVGGCKAIPPVVARIFSGGSTSPLTRDGHGCPKLNAQSFARMRNQQSVHMARMW